MGGSRWLSEAIGCRVVGACRPRLLDDTHYLFQMGVTFECQEMFTVVDEETKVGE
jgi:hypothetical protein